MQLLLVNIKFLSGVPLKRPSRPIRLGKAAQEAKIFALKPSPPRPQAIREKRVGDNVGARICGFAQLTAVELET